MGTNYYLRIIPSERKKKALKSAITQNNFNEITSIYERLYGTLGDYPDKDDVINKRFGYLHLGKRSGGWKFLWNPNVYTFVVEKDSKWVNEFIPLYEFTKKGISKFLHSFKNAYIVDEYNLNDPPILTEIPSDEKDKVKDDEYLQLYEKMGQWSIEGFLQMAFNWGKEYTLETQYRDRENHYYISYPLWDSWVSITYPNIETCYGDYWNDGLRFSNTNNFS